jgi:hypothetical protein
MSALTCPRILAPGFPLNSRWREFSVLLYGVGALGFLGLGKAWFFAAYLILAAFLCTRSFYFDVFSPGLLAVHAFGIYFLAVMAFNKELTTAALAYVVVTLLLYVVISLGMPKLGLSAIRELTSGFALKRSIRYRAIAMQVTGMAIFAAMVRLAGFSSPIEIFSAPLQYRFFMMTGGMTYVKLAMDFLILAPVLIVTIAYYLHGAGRMLWWTCSCIAMFYALCTGERSAPIILIVQLLIIRHLFGKRLSTRLVLSLAFLVIPFVAVMGEYRMVRYAQASGALDTVVHNMDPLDMLRLSLERLDASIRFNELMRVYKGEPLRLGLSYLSLPVQVFPRALWKEKPRIPNPEMTRIIGRDDPNLDIAFDFGIFGETLINFWWAGVLLAAVIAAVAIGVLQAAYERVALTEDPVGILWCALFWMTPVSLIVSGLVQATIFFSFGLLALIALREIFFIRTMRTTLPTPQCLGA